VLSPNSESNDHLFESNASVSHHEPHRIDFDKTSVHSDVRGSLRVNQANRVDFDNARIYCSQSSQIIDHTDEFSISARRRIGSKIKVALEQQPRSN